MDMIHQQDIFEDSDGVIHVRVGDRWLMNIPAWLYMSVRGGGIQSIIQEYGLQRFNMPSEEAQAIRNIEDEARAVWRYWRRKGDQHYYNLLGQIDRDILLIERMVMRESPHAKGRFRYELIANEMRNHGHAVYGPQHAKQLLNEVTEALVQDQREREAKKTIEMIKTMEKAEKESEIKMFKVINCPFEDAGRVDSDNKVLAPYPAI